ncbi:MAG: 3-hydroxyacyl-ACP dehydratase FabZ [Chlamydiota bacterium]|nr:3-hydroxyacyl-ACP dehydratase FabZ [Chlamydiota bacterium]
MKKEEFLISAKAIKEILPHRYPFLLIDCIAGMDIEQNWILAKKNVSMNEPFFQGHFPEAPIMPGVLIIEALAQAGGVLIHQKGFKDETAVLLSIRHAKFRFPVYPGDCLELHVQGKHLSAKGGKVFGEAKVGNAVCAEAEILFAMQKMANI